MAVSIFFPLLFSFTATTLNIFCGLPKPNSISRFNNVPTLGPLRFPRHVCIFLRIFTAPNKQVRGRNPSGDETSQARTSGSLLPHSCCPCFLDSSAGSLAQSRCLPKTPLTGGQSHPRASALPQASRLTLHGDVQQRCHVSASPTMQTLMSRCVCS